MKVLIDNPIKFYNSPNYFQTLEEFGDIVQIAASSMDENELKDRLSDRKYSNFIFGFGSSHFWASQRVKRGEEVVRNVFVEFKKEWEKAMDGVRGKNANFVVVDDLKEVKEKQVTDIEIATIYTTYWDSNPDSQGNVFAKHSIKKEHLEAMKKRGEMLDYQVDDIGIKITKRWELKEDKTEGILKSKRIEL